jgi:hypothetical protein
MSHAYSLVWLSESVKSRQVYFLACRKYGTQETNHRILAILPYSRFSASQWGGGVSLGHSALSMLPLGVSLRGVNVIAQFESAVLI